MRSTSIAASLLTGLLAACATGDRSQGETGLDRPEASIPFADQRTSIRDWQADGTQGIWVQDARRNWYYGTFHAVCFGLDFATVIGFRTGATGRLDRFSSIEVPDQGRCTLRSFTTSEAPPEKGEQDDDDAASRDAS